MQPPETTAQPISLYLTAATLVISMFVWIYGLANSPLFDPALRAEKRFLQEASETLSPQFRKQRALALAYWKRYKDVRTDPFFGENGLLGISGARDHYDQHGRHEGRVYGPLPEVADLEREKALAAAYWLRYPDVADSAVWGKNGSLGVLGPRDHYRHVGKYQSRSWGLQTDKEPGPAAAGSAD